MSSINPNKCVQYIKLLQKTVEDLKVEKDNALKSEENAKFQLSMLQKRFNDFESREAQPSTSQSLLQQHAPTSENATIASLTTQNLNLRKELTNRTSSSHTQRVVNASNVEEVVDQYKKKISQKNEQISLLEQRNDEAELTNKVCKLQQLLKKTLSVNHSYAQQILSLEEQLISLVAKENQEAQVETVSGDQDLNNSANANVNDEEINELKSHVADLKMQLQQEVKKRKDVESNCQALITVKETLENENLQLLQKNKLLSAASTNDFPIESQLKIFVDDYEEERCQKEKQWKENQEIKGENSRLQQKVDNLTALLRSQSMERVPVTPQAMQRPPVYHQRSSLYEEGYQDNAMRPSYPPVYGDPNTGQSVDKPLAFPLNAVPVPQPGMQRPARTIGYTMAQSRGPRPISPPYTQQAPVPQSFPLPSMAAPSRGYHPQPGQELVFSSSQQPYPGNYVQADQAPPSMTSGDVTHKMEKTHTVDEHKHS